MKYIQIVLDGAGDIGKTPLMVAKKPNIDALAKKGTLGLYKIKYGSHVNSDVGYLALLDYHQKNNYPGRGYLEALGLNLHPKKSDICIRGNFATIDRKHILIDRRAGREEYGLDKICKRFDGMVIDGVKFTVKRGESHRVIIVLHGKGLSKDIVTNDPEVTGVSLPPVRAASKKAAFTAAVVNKFLHMIEDKLSHDAINKKRKVPANTIIIRNAGQRKTAAPFGKRFHVRACCIAGVPIAKGVARFLGIDVINVKGATGKVDTNLPAQFAALKKNIPKYDFIFFHINATDILSHDGQYSKKVTYIEKIDSYIGKLLKQVNMKNTRIVVTCDHRTASSPSYKKYRHLNMPVPFMLSGAGIKSMGMKFDEKACEKGIRLAENKFVQFMVKRR